MDLGEKVGENDPFRVSLEDGGSTLGTLLYQPMINRGIHTTTGSINLKSGFYLFKYSDNIHR